MAPSVYLTRTTQIMYGVLTARNDFVQARPGFKTEQDAQTGLSKLGAAMLAAKKGDEEAYLEFDATARLTPVDPAVRKSLVPIHDQIQSVTSEFIAFASTADKSRFARGDELSQGFDAKVAAASQAIAKAKETRRT